MYTQIISSQMTLERKHQSREREDYLPEVELRQDIPSISLPVSLEPLEELVNQIPEAGD